jgi:xanthosine utilization system XapX-like protein
MLSLRKILNFYIQSSIHVGIAVFCLVRLSVPQWSSYSFLVLFGTIVGYNFLKYSEWFLSNKPLRINIVGILCVTLIAAVGFLLLFLEQEFTIQLNLLMALLLVLLYPFIRKLGWIKPFFVSCVVSYVTVSIPLKDNAGVLWIFLQRFLLLSSVMIPFEILDSTTDAVAMKTLPHLFGIARTKHIGYVLIGLFCITTFYTLSIHYLCFIYALSSVVVIYFSTEKRSWYYTSFWVESLPIVWWLISIVFQ